MSIKVKAFQDKRKDSNNLWYFRAIHPSTINRDTLADRIQANCTVKRSDVLAVLTELVEVMNYELSNGNKVLLDGFGYFYIGVKSIGSIEKEDLDIEQNIQGFRCGFLPTGTRDTATGITSRTFCSGLKAQRYDA